MADRYTYIPSIGLGILAAWGVRALAARSSFSKVLPVVVVGLAIVWTGLSWRQTGFWKNGVTLFGHAIEVTGGRDTAMRNCYGLALVEAGLPEKSIEQFKWVLKLTPKDGEERDVLNDNVEEAKAYTTLSQIYANMGKFDEAVKACDQALELDPKDYRALANRGAVLYQQGKKDEGFSDLKEAIHIAPDYGLAHSNLGWAYLGDEKYQPAIESFKNALQLDARDVGSRNGLAKAYGESGQYSLAISELQTSLKTQYDPVVEISIRELQKRASTAQ